MSDGVGRGSVGYRGMVGASKAKHMPFRGHGGQVFPVHMRGIYAQAGVKRISPFIPGGQTGDGPKRLEPKPGFYGKRQP